MHNSPDRHAQLRRRRCTTVVEMTRLSLPGTLALIHRNGGSHTPDTRLRKGGIFKHKKQQLENRITYYEKGDRRKRAHHLITRGAAIESVAPLTKVLTETEFYAFAEKALAVPEIKGLLMEAVNEHNRAEQKERC